nr:MAG TPA_asm: hypothetical protein [Caudoviricetes sp.]
MQSYGERHSQYMHICFSITMFTAHIVKCNKEHTALYLKYIQTLLR